MPFIRITALGPMLTAGQISRLNTEVTGLMESVLGKVAELTSVLVEQPESARWTIGGIATPVAVHVDATVTAGTNKPEQKALFVERTMTLLKNVFGPDLNPATYVVVTEVPANSWGYDGRTQESRRLLV
ncbi:MAG: tautomerase family protein [Pseudolabrys sp.]|jgi:4-oxalocrotonate tautomerase|nr:tautomerase family protein [Pseudolabrys sp.]